MNSYGIAAVAILHNTAKDTFHPIIYRDAPLPGPDGGKPERVKSAGHHTGGFETLAAAVSHIREDERFTDTVQELSRCVEWDGEGMPADVAFISGQRLVWL